MIIRSTIAFILTAILAASFVSCAKRKPIEERPNIQKSQVKKDTTSTKSVTPQSAKENLEESQFQIVYFDFDKYNLRPDSKAGLEANGSLLRKFPNVIIKIEGHCDERGTIEYNLGLGERRARSAMDYLIALGISANRISIISYGKERPAVMGSSEQAWAKNRRCEFRIISQ